MNRKSVLQPRTRKFKKFYRTFNCCLYWFVSFDKEFIEFLASDAKNRRTMRSTMSTFKSRQSTAGGAARPSIGVRYSMGGKASLGPGSTIKTDKKKLHTNKDPRKLNEKA